MNTEAKTFLKKFSSKRDALAALEILVDYDIKYDPIKEQIEKHQDVDLAQKVMDYFNEVNGTHFTQTLKIRTIITHIPQVNFEQFQSVILHKRETWGNDEKMRQYIRPATLFGSTQKFKTYLDDATNYWISREKERASR
jgi:uncharacterized phage protein (TIGR02220 family)